MKSRTSFFNATVLKKNITQFAPVWGLYTVFLLLFFFAMAERGEPAILARNGVEAMNTMGWINLFYGGICAVMLLGDLFNSRMCNALHAFPLRREGWLLTHVFSGVLFSLAPNILVTVLGSILMWEYAYIAWIWLAVSMLQFLFFFGTGVLSAVCAGNRLAMIAVYGIIHFISLLVYGVAELLYQPLLYGIQLNFDEFNRFFPLMQLVNYERRYVEFSYNPVTIKGKFIGLNTEAWSVVMLCAAVGLAAFVLACLVYRRRKLESAGDFISLQPLAPVFLVIYTIGVGSVFYLFSELFGNASYWYLAVGLAVGFFTGAMLLRRTIKVFTPKAVLGFVVFAAVLAGSMWLTWLDPLGITKRIPETEDVEWAAVYSLDTAFAYTLEDDASRFNITDPEELEELKKFHSQLVAARDTNREENTCEIRVLYALKNGTKFVRYYQVDVNSQLGQEMKYRLSDMRYVFQTEDTQTLYERLTNAKIECYDMNMGDKWGINSEFGTIEMVSLSDKEQIAGLLDAIEKDCRAGNMAQLYAYHENESQVFCINFEYIVYSYEESYKWKEWYPTSLMVYGSCSNTINYLQQLDVDV